MSAETLRLLFSGTVVSNGGDRAIVEAQLQTLGNATSSLHVDIADNLPGVAPRLMANVGVRAAAYELIKHSTMSGRIGRARRRLDPQRVLLAARTRGTMPRLTSVLCSPAERMLIEDIAGYDGVVYCGGTSLVESYWLAPKFFELELASALGVPVTLMTQSLGPFHQRRNRRAVKALCSRAALILLRDEKSLTNLQTVRADTSRARVLPDIVFAMADAQAIAAIRDRRLEAADGMAVAISVRELANYKQYTQSGAAVRFDEAMVGFVTRLVRDGHRVTFVSTCQGTPEYWTDDSKKAEEICAALPDEARDKVTVDSAERSTVELRQLLSTFDIVVATRLHAAILALTAGTVVLPIAYEFKTVGVFTSLDLSQYVLDAETLTESELVDQFFKFSAEIDRRRPELAALLQDVVLQANDAGEITVAALAGTTSRQRRRRMRRTASTHNP